jgi:amino acid adenylation domain-containing protein/non-ribosomal peptide synthase protein (TIGR01720 family)
MRNDHIEDVYPCSPMQQGMIFHTLYAPESGVYIFQINGVLRGNVNASAFGRAWQLVIDRHPVLRTAFGWQSQDNPFQVVGRHVELKLRQLDWRGVPATEQAQRLATFLKADREQGFDLAKAPLLRLALLRLADDLYHFCWSSHHLLLDGWSTPLLFKEAFMLYRGINRGEEVKLEVSRSYREYIEWLQGQDLEQAEQYWRERLRGFSAPTPLGVDHPAPDLLSPDDYSEQKIHLSQATTTVLQALARHHQLTLNTIVQGAWALLLSRYSRQQDVVFGATVSGRPANLEGVERMVGPFINTLPVRVKVREQAGVMEWLKGLQAEQVEMREYEYSPLVEVQGWSEVGRGVSLFESAFVFENYPVERIVQKQDEGYSIGNVESAEMTNYPLTLVVEPGRQVLLRIMYDCGRLDEATVSRMLKHLLTLLSGIAAHPGKRVSELPFLTEEERHQLLAQGNNASVAYPQKQAIHQLFQTQVEQRPDAVALVYEDRQLTYRELNERANRLAHHLQSLGVGPELRVAICVERSVEMVIGLLGILKAGGAYVPLDPEYPKERLAFILRDAQASVLLTQRELVARLPEHEAHVVLLEPDPEAFSGASADNPHSDVSPDNLAYVIYTSGSTGLPKGVLVSHANVLRLFAATHRYFNFDATDVWSLFHSYAFDFSVWELWGALLYGGRLVLVPHWVARSPQSFYQLLLTEQVTVLNQTPSAFRQLIQVEESDINSGGAGADSFTPSLALRLVIFGGEALDLQSLKGWFDRHGDHYPQLVNMYGITETTVHVTYRRLLAADLQQSQRSLIGAPLPDLRLYLLDHQQLLAPCGVAGEICVGGAGVARGYLQRADLTAERFIPDALSGDSGARLYRSGDVGRYGEDGELEYVGRQDAQVKVRGYRIELGEVEAALRQHQGVAAAVVVAREGAGGGGSAGEQRLVGYVVGEGAGEIGTGELRSYLEERLPEYMIPAVFVQLPEMPLTPNGKVDRKALPAPDHSRPDLEHSYLAPRTHIEEMLAGVWKEVLKVEAVGVHDNFFELGGDSILSIQIVARAARSGLHLTPRDLFQHPTIAALAAVVSTNSSNKVEAEQGAVSGAVALTPIQHWFFEQEMEHRHHFNQAVLLEVPAGVEAALLQRVVEKVVEHHDALRLRYKQVDGVWQQWNAEVESAEVFTVVDLSQVAESEQSSAITAAATQSQASLNLEDGPLIKVTLMDLGGQHSKRLLIVIHHLAVDGVSWRILIEDFERGYEQAARGQAISLGAKTSSFRQWAERLVEYAHSETLRAQESYWLAAGREDVVRLPMDQSGGVNSIESERQVNVSLSEEETRALLTEVPGVYHTQINDVLLTAVSEAISRWSGERRVLIGLEGHGREEVIKEVDVTRTVGWFTALYPAIIEVERGAGIGEQLKSVKEQLRKIPERGVGYGLLKYVTGEEGVRERVRGMGEAEVAFNYLGQFEYFGRLEADEREGGRWTVASESSGSTESGAEQRRHLLEINGGVTGGRLVMTWSYSENVHRRTTIKAVAERFIGAMRELIAHCQRPEAGGYTPSDFSLTELDQEDLNKLLGEVTFGD